MKRPSIAHLSAFYSAERSCYIIIYISRVFECQSQSTVAAVAVASCNKKCE